MNLSPTVKETYRMIGPITAEPDTHTLERAAAPRPNTPLRSSRFKYYIHDGIDACRFELIGELTEADVQELAGCWRTARTTLSKRKLVLDLRGLKTIDDLGRRWVASMAVEGAVYVPSPHLQGLSLGAAVTSLPVEHAQNTGPLGKLAAKLRTFRPPSPESSTPAR